MSDTPARKLQSENFKKLSALAPAFMRGEAGYVELISPRAPIVLIELQRCREDLCDSSAVITQITQSGGHRPITDANMMFMISDTDGLIKPISLYREGWTVSRCVYTDDDGIEPDIEQELGEFMSEWLDALGEQGFEPQTLERCSDMDMNMADMSC